MNRAFTKGFAGGIILAGVLFVAFKLLSANYPDKKPQTTILLSGANCTASEPIQLRGQKNDQVKWQVRNTCGTAFYVKVDNFRAKNEDGSVGNPTSGIVTPVNGSLTELRTPNLVQPNGTGEIIGRIDATVSAETFYKYEIFIGPQPAQGQPISWSSVRDPDIDIWP
jgi:hypothetical protein